MRGKSFNVHFDVAIRYKNKGDRDWKHMWGGEIKNYKKTLKCSDSDNPVCSSFSVAYLPVVTYDTYDVYVHVHKSRFINDPER